MSATDELRRLLDERGVEYEAYRDVMNRRITKWRIYHGAFVFFAVEKEGKLFVETASDTEHSAICTPAQAIAATLGGCSYYDATRNRCECYERELGGGKLTAEQVREAIEKRFEFSVLVPKQRWQAIADALNATLGGGECEVVQGKKGPKCSKCGKELPEDPYSDYEGNFCPTCGARIQKAVER